MDVLGVAWNAFLALVPVALAYLIASLWRCTRASLICKGLVVVLGMAWFAFLPNASYLVTEWRHFLERVHHDSLYAQWITGRDQEAMVQLIAYSLFYLGYSLFGLFTFALAIRPLIPLVKERIARLWLVGVPFFLLVSTGVYLGLILRYNSWDLLHRPGIIWADTLNAYTRPFLVALLVAFAAFLWVSYFVFDIWIDGFVARFRKHKARAQTSCHSPAYPDWIDG